MWLEQEELCNVLLVDSVASANSADTDRQNRQNKQEEKQMIIGEWGEDKSGKTTLGLTFPKPMTVYEFDVGGVDRAKWRFNKDFNAGLVKVVQYPMPLQIIASKDKSKLSFSNIIVGHRELWEEFMQSLYHTLMDEKVVTVMIDTGTLMWEICRNGYLQEKQEANVLKKEKIREKLLPIEYAEPNARMRSILHACKAKNKHLVITHHARDEFISQVNKLEGKIEEVRSGKRERSGWTGLGDVADLIVQTYFGQQNGDSKPTNYCNVNICGLVKEMEGMTFKEPTCESLMQAVDSIRANLGG